MKAGIGGHWMETSRTKVAQSQVYDKSIGRRTKSFKSVLINTQVTYHNEILIQFTIEI